MVNLRPYQSQSVDELRAAYVAGAGGALLELGTGAGKTVTAVAVVAGVVAHGGSVVWLAHRCELLDQARTTMVAAGLAAALNRRLVYLATVQSRLPVDLPEPTVIVVDEGHRALAASYRAVFARWPESFRLLLTGTAWRSDGADFAPVAEVTVRGPDVGELTQQGWLVPANYWSVPGADFGALKKTGSGDFGATAIAAAMDRPQLVGDVAATFARLAFDRVGVVFCAGLLHADHVCEGLLALGVSAEVVWGGSSKSDRARLLGQHGRYGGRQVLVCADLLVEGWDNPLVSCVVVARATASVIIWRQTVGRGLRLADGKSDCIVIDHGGNCARLGLVDEALVYEPDESGGARGSRDPDAIGLLTCAACFAVLPSVPRPVTCSRCFAVLPRPKVRGLEAQAGDLVPFDAAARKAARPAMDWTAWRKLDAQRVAAGYRPGWTWARYYAQTEVKLWVK